MADVEYLPALHGAGVALYCGIGLPEPTIVVLDHKRAFRMEDSLPTNLRLCSLPRGEDIYLALLWHRFGLAECSRGEVTALNPKKCFSVCDWKGSGLSGAISASQPLPHVGDYLDAFGWAKWNTRIVQILDVKLFTGCPPL